MFIWLGQAGALPALAQKVYWTDRNADRIRRANVDGSQVEDLVASVVASPRAIALDTAASKMYWADAGTRKIQRADLDGANVEDLVTQGLVTPSGIALDLNAGVMYWTDTETETIQRAGMDVPSGETADTRTDVETVVVAAVYIEEGIAVDAAGGKIYWASSVFGGGDALNRSNLDGSDTEELVTTGFRSARAIALDLTAQKVYWAAGSFTDAKLLRAGMVIPDGETPDNRSDVEILLTSELGAPFGIAVDSSGGKVYWTDASIGHQKLQRADLDGSNVEELASTGLVIPDGIALDPAMGHVYWTDWGGDKIQRANVDGSSIEDVLAATLVEPRGLALDLSAGRMYWTDTGTDKIQRAGLDVPTGQTPLNRSDIEDLVTGAAAYEQIALDLTAGKMYWIDATYSNPRIRRANLDGSVIEDLATGEVDPFGLAVDPVEGKVYWGDYDVGIRRANLDGSAPEDFLGLSLPCVTDVALDLAERRIYWGNFCTDTIERAHLGDAIAEPIVAGVDTANELALDLMARKLYWTNTGYPTLAVIQRANLDGSDAEDVVATGLNSPWGIAIDRVAPGDCDLNGIVSLADVGIFVDCIAGPNAADPDCACDDPDEDGDFDLHDIAILQDVFTGSGS